MLPFQTGDSHGAESQLSALSPWFLASCWQCWVLGTDFGKTIGAKYDVVCSYGPCILACFCHLSHGMVESWPELGALLLTNTTCLYNSWMFSIPCSALLFFLWENKPDEMKGWVWSQTDPVWIPGLAFLLVWSWLCFFQPQFFVCKMGVLFPILQVNDDYTIYCM